MTDHIRETAGQPVETDTQAALDAGLALAKPVEVDKGTHYSVVVPAGGVHALVRVPEEHLDAPRRSRAVYRPATVEALIQTIDRHHDKAATTIWVHPHNGQIVAVFNDHEGPSGQGPGWRDHRAELHLTATPEWRHWTGQDNQLMSQREFAEHVEDGATEIVEPPAADMLELAQSFHATQSATFRTAVRLQDGRIQAQYDEEVQASAGQSGQMTIPSTFTLAVSPFLGEDPYRLQARLRYRVASGSLRIGYKLVQRPENVLRDALGKIAEQLAEKFPAVFIGEPGV